MRDQNDPVKLRLALALAANLLVAAPGAGSDQRVVFDVSVHPPGAQVAADFSAVISLESVSNPKRPATRIALMAPGRRETTLPAGLWRAHVDGDRLFHEPRIITVPPSSPVHAALDTWRTGTVSGQIKGMDGSLPKTVEVRWSATDSMSSPAPPPGSATCVLSDDRFSCQVPLGELDLRLRAEGFVSKYLWGIEVGDAPRDLGLFPLERGGSITGWVKPERGVTGDLTKAVVEVRSDALTKPITAPVNARGFFHVERVAAGDYLLNVRLGEISADPRTVHVLPDTESELIEDVVLSRPRKLTVEVKPARSFAGQAWQVKLERVHATDTVELAAKGVTDANGRIEWKTIRPGRYSIVVAEDSRSAVAFRELEVSDLETEIPVHVPRTHVTGRVTLRDRGVATRLWLGGKNRVPSVEVRSDDDGRFSATVPFDPAETWLISLETRTPRIARTLRLKPSVNEGTGDATLEIELPENALAGTIVDEQGNAVSRAIVNLAATSSAADGLLQTTADINGTFEFSGLEKGTYEIQASDFQQRQSDVIAVSVADDPYQEIKLVVRKKITVIGRVIAPSGEPVPHAEVTAFPTDRPVLHVESAITGADGVFSLKLPPETRAVDFMVVANGLALKTFHVPAVENGLTIVADSTGGQIAFDIPQFADDPAAPRAYFIHKGAVTPVQALAYLPATRFEPSKRGQPYLSLLHPLMDDGDYSLCMLYRHDLPAARAGVLPADRCVSGYVSPWGSLRLEAPASLTSTR